MVQVFLKALPINNKEIGFVMKKEIKQGSTLPFYKIEGRWAPSTCLDFLRPFSFSL
jgi:hypothetical protein